ncbi:dihydrolipoyl dehydrogenase [Castellaniella caeni]|uniref:dihydrolipoyl dehydrogenase n=1 Tax=Castellaniella caeni TaxID=266123 RepID=UPI00082C88AC|nr:dihydrolipoyl dehydrogenase [Castellaniella caeni]
MAQTAYDYDVAVVGAGPGGYVAAIRAAQLGLRTALIEKADLGGICLNWGCIPTKALLRSADVLRLARAAAQFGVQVTEPRADLAAMVARSRQVAGQLQRGVAHLMKKHGVEVIRAQASLAGRGCLNLAAVTGDQTPTRLRAKSIILATGARARELPGLAPDPASVWYYREALAPTFLPRRLLVVGAGAIGIEFASFYHALGAQVQVAEMAEHVLPAEDVEVSVHMEASLRKQGIRLHLGTRITATRRVAGAWQVTLEGHEQPCDVDVILVATGIQGNVEQLGLERTAVRVEKTHILTDAWCQTGEPGVYAIGDVAGAPWLAHKASHEAVLCVEKIAGLDTHPLVAARVPACTYSHPQVAHVGLTEAQARANGRAVKVGKFPFVANGKAIALGDTEGFVKVIFDDASGELLGAHMVGAEVTEMIQGYGIAMGLETTEAELMQAIFAHPTQSEAMHEAVLSAYGRALHV